MKQPTLSGDLEVLGLSVDWLKRKMGNPGTVEAGNQALESAKEEIKRVFRQKSKELHPDTGGDQDAFVEARDAYERLMGLKFVPKQRPVTVITINPWAGWGSSTTTSTSGTWTTTGPTTWRGV